MLKKILLIGVLVVAGGFLLMQLVPYGRNHSNPLAVSEPNWDSPETRVLAERACFDCHSNETVWPWYSNVAPISWLVYHDTVEGREHLNFSDWDATLAHWEGHGAAAEMPEEMAETIHEGEMPLPNYLIMHPEAKLTDTEKTALANGLVATAGGSASENHEDTHEHEDHDEDHD